MCSSDLPLVTPTSQIVGSQAVVLALDRKKGNPDYTNKSNQFISLVKGEYGKTPVPVNPEFRTQITGDPTEHPYDVTQYKKPENPVLEEFGGVKLASNNEEYLLLELLPSVATGFLRNKRAEEYAAAQAEAAKNAPAAEQEEQKPQEPITGEVLSGPMPGTILEISVNPGDKVAKGQKLLVYESMKMENDVEAEHDAVVKRIFVKPGDRFAADAPLIEFQD